MIDLVEFDTDTFLTGIRVSTIQETLDERGADELTAPHRVGFYALILVTEGNGFHFIDNKLYHCHPGTLLVLSPQQVHYFESSFRWKGLVITFQDAELFALDDVGPNPSMIKSIRGVDVMSDMIHLVGQEFEMLHQEAQGPRDTVSSGLQRNLLQNILYKVFFRSSYTIQSQPKNKEVQDFQVFSDLVERCFNERHNVSDYTGEIKISPKRLNSVCKKVKGVTAKQIIDARLLLEAKRLIGYTNIPISHIAESLGFNEPTNLAKFFRKHTDISPTEFRNMSKPFATNN